MSQFNHLFGPVQSRRYGRSLGVDLVPLKTCTLDCVFCQLGPTAATTVDPVETVSVRTLTGEIRAWLHQHHYAVDWIALGGSGEPTLHPGFGQVLAWIRKHTSCKSLLLTNGTRFTDRAVRIAAAQASAVKISLHAWDQASFQKISRPHPSLDFDDILAGFRAFREIYTGTLDLEVFVIPGINDTLDAMNQIAVLSTTFAPDRVTLNTAVRPPAESWVKICPPKQLRQLAKCFSPPAQIPRNLTLTNSLTDPGPTTQSPPLEGTPEKHAGSVARPPSLPPRPDLKTLKTELLNLIRRHPARAADLAPAFSLTQGQTLALLRKLEGEGRARRDKTNHWHATSS